MNELFTNDRAKELWDYVLQLQEGVEKRWLGAAIKLAGLRAEFTVEDIRYTAGDDIETNREGPLMAEAKRLGIIKPVRYTKSERPEAKGRRIPVYTKGWA